MPLPVLLSMLLLLTAQADPLRWAAELPEGEVASIELLAEDGHSLTRFLCQDGGHQRQFGWRPDLDPRPGHLSAEVAVLWLEPGRYRLRQTLPGGVRELPVPSTLAPPRELSVRLPDSATGVLATRWTEQGGQDGLAYASRQPDGQATLPLDDGHWEVFPLGVTGYDAERIGDRPRSGSEPLSFRPQRRPPERQPDRSGTWAVRLLLTPVSALLLALGALGAWTLRRTRGLTLAALLSVSLAVAICWDALRSPSLRLLMAGPSFEDPVTSASLLAATADSLRRLSDISTTFSFPEGHSWLMMGPAWLPYLLASPIAWVSNAVVAHNVGVAIGLALLGVSAFLLARRRGADPLPALLATGGAMLAPVVLGEVDTASLDRLWLFTVPLTLLALGQAANPERPRGWVLATAGALAATFYGQIYYGLYLAAAAPLLALPHLFGARPWARLGRLCAVGGLALLLLVPGLVTLRVGTVHTEYDSTQRLWDTVPDLLHPVSAQQAQGYLRRYDPRVGGDDPQRPLDSPQERLLAAVASSTPPSELAQPFSTLIGRKHFWWLMLGALLVARRRRAVWLGAWETAVLMTLALGPLLRTGPLSVGPPLPYYALHLGVFGFDQLKHPDRYAILAAVLAPAPLAVGLSGLLDRLRLRHPGVVGAVVAAAIVLGTAVVGSNTPATLARPWTAFVIDQHRPKATLFPRLPLPDHTAALFLPTIEPLPPDLIVPALRHHLSLVNDPPHGMSPRRSLPYWAETNVLLNAIAWESGSDRPRRYLGGEVSEADRAELRRAGLTTVVLFREWLTTTILVQPTETLLDAQASRLTDTDAVIVWRLP